MPDNAKSSKWVGMAPAFVGKPPHLRIKSSEQPILARFFAPRLFEAFRKSKSYLQSPIIED
jgi:hypothetical protein